MAKPAASIPSILSSRTSMDGNTAAAYIAYRVNEVCAIYPITPSSTMAELVDEWASQGIPNIFGGIPSVIEMQSEGGAAGAVHGALQSGALTTTFTASQGLLLMLPNMAKIAGELTSAVFHVAARSIATSALSIFGDHSDVMAVRSTGFAMIASASVQEAHDGALLTQAATLEARVPFVHFFDGFRTSHELNSVELIPDDVIRAMIPDDLVRAHRRRALNPEHPFIRGTAHNPDTFFQAREAVTPYYQRTPEIVERVMTRFAELTGRRYRLFEYVGAPDAERVLVIMASGAETACETARALMAQGERVGVVQVRLYRPWSAEAFLAALPPSVSALAVLDRTKEPGAAGEPLYLDVLAALAQASAAGARTMPRVVGGRYGLSSKDFSPAMVKAVFDELRAPTLRQTGGPRWGFRGPQPGRALSGSRGEAARPAPVISFTVGIHDDVSGSSLDFDPGFSIEPADITRAVFYGLGADGTVGANKNSVKILEAAGLYAQGYFIYDSHKSGAQTISHLRFGRNPIHAPYLIAAADFVACHRFEFLAREDVLALARPGAVFLLNCPFPPEQVWDNLPLRLQHQIADKRVRFFVIDASAAAREAGLGSRVNTVLQTCFFAISGVLPRDQAIARIKKAIEKSYGRHGDALVRQNFAAVDGALARLHEVAVPLPAIDSEREDRAGAPGVPGPAERQAGGAAKPRPAPRPSMLPQLVPASAPEFVRTVTAPMLAGQGESLPVSLIPADGTWPSGTCAFEKRNIADDVPVWNPDLCIQCGQCGFVCPHSVIRARYYNQDLLASAPVDFQSAPVNARGFPDVRFTLQFYFEDCTGCGVCVEACPAREPENPDLRAINMVAKREDRAGAQPLPRPSMSGRIEDNREHIRFFETLPVNDRSHVDFANVRGVQYLEPLFEFSGACAGCGETPYLKVLSQLFGDRMQVANATGCSSIYGGNLPVTPWTKNFEGRGPAWSNSLFEDNAEFGLGFRLACDQQLDLARALLRRLAPLVGEDLSASILAAPQRHESEIRSQRLRLAELRRALTALSETRAAAAPASSRGGPRPSMSVDDARDLEAVMDQLVRRSIWIVGGDGWAYDIGYGGLDHVLAARRNVNVLVLDTGVYSNTGGQASKSTPLGAIARFAAAGKRVARKDLALQAIAYGHVYVAQVAMGANPQQTLLALREAEAYDGPSLILAYSQCIAHGIDMRFGMRQQALAVATGFWPLFRFNPEMRRVGESPFQLDSPRPTAPLSDFTRNESRFTSLQTQDPQIAAELARLAQDQVLQKYRHYESLAHRDDGAPWTPPAVAPAAAHQSL